MAFYVTTPIYYVNAAPHLGHAYTCIGADILARHHRQRGEDVFFLTGTDEHGEPVVQVAEREGISPKELADRNAQRFQALMPRINVSIDYFIRTSDPRHKQRVQEVMQRIHDNGHVYKGLYEGWYCPKCADFKTEAEIGPGNTCPIHQIPLDREKEENWFFRLSAFEEPLKALYADRPEWVTPRTRYNEALAFINGGLQDVSLSRAKISWGVEVPWDPAHVFYVWFDALLNYYTALSFARDGEDLTSRFWPAFHVIGKDILKFHAVYWPAMLMAAGIELPEGELIHGFLLMRDASGAETKMSKSLGNVLDPFQVMDTFGTDALRYYCFREVSFGHDGGVSTLTFGERYETELANEYGNLASRTLAMIARYRDGVTPDTGVDPELALEFAGLVDEVTALLGDADITQALERIWQRVRRLNRYVEERAPWQLAKDEAKAAELDTTLRSLAEGLRSVTVLLHPYMPETAGKLLAALGQPELALQSRRLRRTARRQPHRVAAAALPEAAVIDSHTHLDSTPGTDAEIVAAATAAGVTRILTIGTSADSARAAQAAAENHPEVWFAVGQHPNSATDFSTGQLDELRELARHPRCVAIGETGLDDYRDYAPRADQERAFHAHIELARELGKPLVIHTRAADDDTIATLARAAEGLQVVLHCFSMPDRLAECADQGWWTSFAGNVTYPKARELAYAAEQAPLERLLVETDAPYLTPQPVRKHRNQPAFVIHTARFIAERRGLAYAELEAALHDNSARLFGW